MLSSATKSLGRAGCSMTAPHESWFRKAEDDIAFARLGLEHCYYSQVCFLSQQAAEKALKALLLLKTDSHPHIHNLVELIRRCAVHTPKALDLTDRARILDQYYIPSRYPDGVPGGLPAGLPGQRHAEEALDTADAILNFCREATVEDV